MEFSVAQNFYAFRHFCDFRLNFFYLATQNSIWIGVCETKFFDTTNRFAAMTKKRIPAKPLVWFKKFTSWTHLRIQFWLRWLKNEPKNSQDVGSRSIYFYILLQLSDLKRLNFGAFVRSKVLNMWSRRSAIERCRSSATV